MSQITIISAKELLRRIQSNIKDGTSFLDTEIGFTESVIPFLKDEHNKVEGYFLANNSAYIIYSKIIPPTEIDPLSKVGIFQALKLYGSSGKYKGVIDGNGNSILPNIYQSIEPFMNDIIKVEYKNHKFGLIRISGEVILEPIYDRIDSLGELVFAVCKDGKLGFMNLKGEIVIPFIYEMTNDEVVFYNGLAAVAKKDEVGKCRFGYINHKNEEILPFKFTGNIPFKNTNLIENWEVYEAGYGNSFTREYYYLALDGSITHFKTEHIEDTNWIEEHEITYAFDESHRYDDGDWLDAFEGDSSNKWNVD